MLKEYNKLWVFGDSYTTPHVCVDPRESFWGLLSQHLGITSINNCSRPVNSFDAVCQLLVGLQNEIQWSTDLVLIGIPPLERIAVFDNHKNTEYLGHTIDAYTWQDQKFDIAVHRGIVSLQNYGTDKELIIHHDRSWLETQTLRTVFFLTQWLDSINANYMILNLSKDFDINNVWGPSNFVLPYCINHPRCIMFKDTYHGINIGVNKPADSDMPEGHHGPAGNRYYFEKSLLPTMQKCNLI
tara:strand:+ start:185 stop:907 length:723 start_codon:yes stop_codon:yes gene_type:complete